MSVVWQTAYPLSFRYLQGSCSGELTIIIPPVAAHNRKPRANCKYSQFAIQIQRSGTGIFSKSFVSRVSEHHPDLQIFRSFTNSCFPIPAHPQYSCAANIKKTCLNIGIRHKKFWKSNMVVDVTIYVGVTVFKISCSILSPT